MGAAAMMFMLIGAVLNAQASSLSAGDPSVAVSRSKTIILTDDDNGRDIRLKRGELLEIHLRAQFGTGYSWQLTKPPESRLKFADQSVVSAPPGDESGKETQIFRFEARSAGNFTLRLDHMRPWEKGVEPTKTFSISGKIVSVRQSDRRRKSTC